MRRCLLSGLLIAWATACQVRNPDWCDATNPCSDGRLCDVDGKAGLKNTCITATGVPCPDAGVCPSATPVCRQGFCAPCTTPSECRDPTRPVCGASGACAPCAMDHDCPTLTRCAPSGACFECLSASDCPTAAKPACSAAGVCGSCGGDPDCAGHVMTPHCGAGGACVECRTSSDCPSIAAPHCQAGTCGPCTIENDCSARTGTTHCGAGGACVECRTGADCPAARPVCDASATCQPCTTDSECPDLCDADSGACVAPSDILFVSSGGAGDCSKAAPCGAIQTALAKVSAGKKKWIKVGAGMYFEALTVSGVAVEIVGTGATVLPRAVGVNLPGALVENGASATFRGLDFSGASGGASADGVLCAGSVATPTRVTLRQVTLDSNGQYGLDAMNCVVDLERSLVTRNQGGGVALFACDFTLANNFIVNNGLATATFGGVNILRDPPSGAGAGLLAFNTIARNSEPAVKCSDQVTTLTFADDIVFGNGTTQVVNSGAKCMWKYSDIAPMPVGGTGNIGTDPMFVNPEADDYHLAAGSPCVNTADPAATVDIDFDGDPRPAQGRADMGADEVP